LINIIQSLKIEPKCTVGIFYDIIIITTIIIIKCCIMWSNCKADMQ